MDVQFLQHVVYNDYDIQVLLIPDRGYEEMSFDIDATSQAIKLVHQMLTTLPTDAQKVNKVFLQFDMKSNAYSIYRIEHQDGSLTENSL